jgi:exopolysaccharide biosynthesis polyprenyl glycosylphosphotransferase
VHDRSGGERAGVSATGSSRGTRPRWTRDAPAAPDARTPRSRIVELPPGVTSVASRDGIGSELAGRGPRRSDIVRRRLIAADAVAALAATVGALVLADPDGRAGGQILWGLPYVVVLVALFRLYGLYERDGKRLAHSTLDDVPQVFHALLIGTLGLWAYLKLVPAERPVLGQVCLFVLLGFMGILVMRASVRRISRHVDAPERVLLVGGGPAARLLVRKIRSCSHLRLEPVGVLADEVDGADAEVIGLPHIGGLDQLRAACGAYDIERVVMASPTLDDTLMTDLVRQANHLGVKVSLLPSLVDVLGPSTEVDDLEGVTVLGLNPVRFSRSSALMKRALDVTVSAAVLLLALPLLPVVALAIKLDSPGPVFFAQDRRGRSDRRFRVYKLRTMASDAEERAEELRASSSHSAWLLLERDPRVTRVGHLLRTTSLDELPQLWNVLRGDMSLVGPRPMPLDTDAHITGWGRRRLDLTPGITGLWQVLGRATIPFEEMIKLDYLYVTNWSLWGDVKLLLKTVFVVMNGRGAN